MRSKSKSVGQMAQPLKAKQGHRSGLGEPPALRGATLSVERGEIAAVMGPSGWDESTLVRCLAGILVPDSGEVCSLSVIGRITGTLAARNG